MCVRMHIALTASLHRHRHIQAHDSWPLLCNSSAQNMVNGDLNHDWRIGGTLRFIRDPPLRLGDRGIVAERILGIILVLLQTVLSRGVPTGGRRLAVVTGVRLVVWVVCVPVTLDGIRTGRVVVAGGEVAEVMVGDLLTWLLRLLRLWGESGLALGWVLGLLVVLWDSSTVEVLLVLVMLLVMGVVGVLGVEAEGSG